MITLLASVGDGGEIGRGGRLVWHIPADLKHFRELTLGNAVIMGRKTWESLPRRPLPGRLNIVVTRNEAYEAPGAVTASSLDEALSLAKDYPRACIIGGESLYREAFPIARCLEITRIYASDPLADTFFPDIERADWRLTEESELFVTPPYPPYRFLTYESSRNLPQ